MVFGFDITIVCVNDRLTKKKTNSHSLVGVNGTSIVADATENIRNNVRVQTMSEIFDTEGYVVWMISDGKLRSLVTLRRFSTILRRQLESFSIFSRSSLFSASDKMKPSDSREEVVAVVSNVMINIPINVTG